MYNYLYTKQNNGKFLLRIEDTDRARFVEGSVENLLESLASVGLIPDEGPNNPGDKGPYYQSERLGIYSAYIDQLLWADKCYHCFCSSERLDELRTQQQELWLPTRYDKKCRFLTEEEKKMKIDAGESYTIRLKVPENTEISFEDTIRGKITVPSKDVDDQVLLKTDGFPTYHFAVVVDDHLMGITDIIRGDEWIPSTPKHVILYQAFWWEMPRFSHVPPLVGMNKKKLSKRTGDVSVEAFLEKWYLPEALLNYISLLGWNPKTTQEILSMDELITLFKIEDVHRAGAVFDIERLEWFNSQYVMTYESKTLWNKLEIYLQRYNPEYLKTIKEFPEEFHFKILEELKTRLKKLSDFKELTQYFYQDLSELDTELIVNKKMKIENLADVKKALMLSLDILNTETLDVENPENIKEVFLTEISNAGMKNWQVLWPLRVALCMQQFSPWALELIHIFGREKSIWRIQKTLKQI